jgi:hypothetical protein
MALSSPSLLARSSVPRWTKQKPPTLRVLQRDVLTKSIAQSMAVKQSLVGRFRRWRVEAWFIPMKSHTPECAKIEQFVANLAPTKTCHFCLQDFDTKNYTLEFYGRSITITRRQLHDGMWHEIARSVLQVKCPRP